MENYSRKEQYGCLSDAVGKAKKGRSGKWGKTALAAAALLTAGGIIAGGLAPADPYGPVPPHEERAAYLVKHLPPDYGPNLRYSPHFRWADMISYDDALVAPLSRISLKGFHTMWLKDNDALNNPEIDTVHAGIWDLKGRRECKLDVDELPGLEETIELQYELATEAFYLALTEEKKTMEGLLGEDEWDIIVDACEGKWFKPGE